MSKRNTWHADAILENAASDWCKLTMPVIQSSTNRDNRHSGIL